MKSTVYRFTAMALAAVVISAAPTAALAKPRFIPPGHAKDPHWNRDDNEYQRRGRRIDDRRAIIVIDGIGCSADDFIMAQHYGVTMEDFLLATIIAQETGRGAWHDYYSDYHDNRSWKRVCRRQGVSWKRVQHRMENRYEDMSNDALKAGVILWALSSILGK